MGHNEDIFKPTRNEELEKYEIGKICSCNVRTVFQDSSTIRISGNVSYKWVKKANKWQPVQANVLR